MLVLLTVADAAARRKVSRQTIFRWIESGRLRHRRIGRIYVIEPRHLDYFTPAPVGNPNPANNGAARRRGERGAAGR